jgi:hypothetical protein
MAEIIGVGMNMDAVWFRQTVIHPAPGESC